MELVKNSGVNPFNKIVLSTQEEYIPIRPEDILYCKANDCYTYFFLIGGRQYIVSKRLKEYEERLTDHNFFRIHRSYLVNINHIERISKVDGTSVLMSNGDLLIVSSRKKDAFLAMIKTVNK